MPEKLFTYFGNKQRIAEVCWGYFGETKAYSEPFAGCATMLLKSPYRHIFETINDADCYVVNAFRSVKYHPETVIEHLYNPRFEMDLHARHDYLVNRKVDFGKEMYRDDPKFCDPELAAWWIWGINLWIGGSWCSLNHKIKTSGTQKLVHRNQGVLTKSKKLVHSNQGVLTMSQKLVHRNRGVLTKSKKLVNCNRGILSGADRREIIDTMVTAVFDRLIDVTILYGDFERVLTPSYTTHFGTVAVFLDPPYLSDEAVYENDDHDGSVWNRARDWFVANMDNKNYRIILCGEERQWPCYPESVRKVCWNRSAGMNKDRSEANRKECLWISPGCEV